MNQDINVNLNLPDNVLNMLSGINTKLDDLTASAGRTSSAWENMLEHTRTFNILEHFISYL